jgi:hypothetical protein
MFGLLIFIPLTAVIILKSTHNYKCDCKRVNSVLLVSQYYEEPFSEHSLQIEEPSLQIEEPSLQIEEPFSEPSLQIEEPSLQIEEPSLQIEEHSLQIEEPFSEHSLQIEEPYVPPEEEYYDDPCYDPDMKLIFASNMLFANSTKNNYTIFEQQIQIQIPIQSSTIMYFAK